jgi:hypothetical protein
MVDTEHAQRRQAAIATEHGDSTAGAVSRASAVRRVRQAAALGVVVLAILGYASFEFAGHVTAAAGHAAAAGSPGTPSPATASAGSRPAARGPVQSAAPRATTHAKVTSPPPATHRTQNRAAVPGLLRPVGVGAFGPDGMGDGDNPQYARNVITDPAIGWQSQWYATATFGGLKDGTGLLLDMGRTVTISSVRLRLSGPPGASLELRLGVVPSLAALHVAQTATATGDVLTIALAKPARAHYVLLWFTRLPPDGSGTYQASVRQVMVDGWR